MLPCIPGAEIPDHTNAERLLARRRALKPESTSQASIEGLTTAAGIWLTAALGFACGAGQHIPAILGTALGRVTLYFVSFIDVEADENGDSPS